MPKLILQAGMLALALTTSAAADTPPPGEFRFESLTARGTGCQPGTFTYNIASDSQAFTVLFGDYAVDTSTRNGRPARKACDMDIDFLVPAGWQFSVYGVQLRGYAALEAGAIGVSKAFTSFGGQRPQQIGRQRLLGPIEDNYEELTDLPLDQAEWSRCGAERTRRFNLRTAITVRPRDARFRDEQGDTDDPSLGEELPKGSLTVDTIDGSLAVQQRYTVAWRPCSDDDGPDHAICSITLGQRSFNERARGRTQQRAKQKATDKVIAACQLGMADRPGADRCRARNAVCTFP